MRSRQPVHLSRRAVLALGASVVAGACGGSSATPDSTVVTVPTTAAASTGPGNSPDSVPAETAPSDRETTTTEYAPLPEPSLVGAVEYAGKRDPFTLGVASGDPTPHRIVLWTRLAPRPLDRDGGMDTQSYRVAWEVSLDPDFVEMVFSGVARADAEHAHSVHVDLSELEPAVEFFYRFRAGPHTSPIGRTQSMPLLTMPDSIIVGTAARQDYESGYFVAHRDAARSRLDLMVFLGGYIDGRSSGSRASGRPLVRRHGLPEPRDVVDYRQRYARYRTDPDLQAAHASCPWVVVGDDAAAFGGTPDTDADIRERRFAARKAWWEHMPVRLPPPERDKEYRTYRESQFGSLTAFTLLDTDQYRAAGTVLGAAQESWFALAHGSRNTVWSAIASRLVLGGATTDGADGSDSAEVAGEPGDRWDAFPDARARLLDAISASNAVNTIGLSSSLSCSTGTDILLPPAPDGSAPVATDFATPAVASAGVGCCGWVRHTITPQTWTADYRIVTRPTSKRSSVSSRQTCTIEATARTPGTRGS